MKASSGSGLWPTVITRLVIAPSAVVSKWLHSRRAGGVSPPWGRHGGLTPPARRGDNRTPPPAITNPPPPARVPAAAEPPPHPGAEQHVKPPGGDHSAHAAPG